MEHWLQNYDPLANAFLSTIVAALPVVVLLSAIAIFRIRIHFSALLGLAVALLVARLAYRMPLEAAAATTVYGAAYGLFPIGWIILNLIFLYQLTVKKGLFSVLRSSLASVAPDPRIQVILVACANLVPKIQSHYWWQGKIESSAEVLIIFKTAKSRLGALEKLIVAKHPYATPEFIVLPIAAGNRRYLDWISQSVRG